MNLFKIPLTFSVLLAVLSSKSFGQETPWQNIGPWMGYINCMAVDSANSDTLYAGTLHGVYKSVDCAENWVKTSMAGIEINALEISKSNSNVLIASSDSMVYKSEDYGENWTVIFQSERTIGAIAIDPVNSSSLWAGVDVSGYQEYERNLYHSPDGGDSWQSVAFPRHVNALGEEQEEMKLDLIRSIRFDPSNDSVIYVIGNNDSFHISNGGVFISKDLGATWINYKMMSSKTSDDDVLAVAATPAGYDPRTVFVLVNDGYIDKKLFKSHDFGDSWEEIGTPGTDYIDKSGKVMEVDPDFPNWVYFGGNYKGEASVLAYDAEQDSWHYFPDSPLKNPSSFLMHPDFWCLSFENGGSYLWGTGDTSWVEKNLGMNDVRILDLVSNPKDPEKIFAALEGKLAKTSDGGDQWSITNISFNTLAICKDDTSFLLAGTAPGGFLNNMDPFYYYQSENGGISWIRKQLFSVNGPVGYSFKLWTGDILLYPNDPGKYIFGTDGGGGGTGIRITMDGGSSWLINFGTGVSTLAQDPTNEEIVYLGTSDPGYVHRSAEDGKNWEKISPDDFVDIVWDIEVDKQSQVFAATSSGLHKWEGGTNWSLLPGIPEISITAMAIDNHSATPVYYVGTEEQGVFLSEDGGLTWENFNLGLGGMNITNLRINDSFPRKLYAGTKDKGIWITTLQQSSTFSREIQVQEITISVFPNPSNGIFSIASNAESGLSGEIKIINLLGKVVYANAHLDLSPGSPRLISLDNMAAGQYVLLFKSDEITLKNKLIIFSDQ